MKSTKTINTQRLSNWFKAGKKFATLDIRPLDEREEWYIPGSTHINAYERLKSGDPFSLDAFTIDPQIPVVTYCAGGNLSLFAAEILTGKGYDAYSLEGGMKSWNYAYDTAELAFDNLKIIQIRRVAKGCLSYIIGSGNQAMVIDASLDPEIYVSIAKNENWEIKIVTDTHIHADFVSRTQDLANYTGAKHFMNSQTDASYAFFPLVDSEVLKLGETAIKVIHTPGHTWESTTFFIDNKVLLTGDTLFTDGIGRPDLKADEKEAQRKSSALYDSLKYLSSFPDHITILPAHISQPIEIGQPIIAEMLGTLKKNIPALKYTETKFMESVLSKLPPTPPNYLKIVEINKTGIKEGHHLPDLEAGSNRCAIK